MLTVAWAELYVRDHGAAVRCLAGLNFRAVSAAERDDQRSTLIRNGDVNLIVTGPTSGRSPVLRWVELHGDGVIDLAIYVPDVHTAVAQAALSGLEVLSEPQLTSWGSLAAIVSGAGSLQHTLVGPSGPSPSRFPQIPPGFAWSEEPVDSGEADISEHTRILGIDHVALCVPAGALATVADNYVQAFGMSEVSHTYVPYGRTGMDSMVLRDARSGITLVLVEPDPAREAGQVDRFLQIHGAAGVQHLAFAVHDVPHAVRHFAARGVGFLPPPEGYYERLAERLGDDPRVLAQIPDLRGTGVVIAEDHGGLLQQIFTATPHDGPLFYELISRRQGAQGFGSAADLFAALEQSQHAADVSTHT